MPGTRKLGRKTDHRMAMLKGMATYLLEYGKIETTVTRAKEVSALTDKMVTLGKANTLASRRQAMSFLKKESVVTKLFTEIRPQRRLYPRSEDRSAPRRRRRDGCHYDGRRVRRVR